MGTPGDPCTGMGWVMFLRSLTGRAVRWGDPLVTPLEPHYEGFQFKVWTES